MPTTEIFTKQVSPEEIAEVVDILSSQGDVRALVLFGSAALGTTRCGEAGYRNPSDIDILVVPSDANADPVHTSARLSSALIAKGIMRPVDVIVASGRSWHDGSSDALKRRILEEGRVLYPQGDLRVADYLECDFGV
jgi:predicted nucleotidyltransferase